MYYHVGGYVRIVRPLLCAKSLFSKHGTLKFSYRASSPRNIFNRALFWRFRAPRRSLVREYEAPTPKTERVSSDLLLRFYDDYHGIDQDTHGLINWVVEVTSAYFLEFSDLFLKCRI